MAKRGIEALPLYPEGRNGRRPTARRVIDVFEDLKRHRLWAVTETGLLFTTELSRLQRKILRLLDVPLSVYDA
jgi:hypothetical protein